ncbi:RNA polymerase sigma factor [Halomonas denitrificans]|nr:RNA polymerase sigma factor [Halomonas denitrificans]
MTDANDELLAIRCQLGEREAFDALIERYADRLRGYVWRVAANDAEVDDLVQDTWLRVLRGLPGLRDPARFRSWLFGIAHRVLVDRLRSRYAAPPEDSSDDADASLADGADLEQLHVDRDQVERGLSVLTPPDREAVWLYHFEQLTLDEIAGATSVPVGTVKSRLHRARKQMRRVLETNADDAGP